MRADLADADALAQTLWAALHGVISLEMLRPAATEVPWAPMEQRLRYLREMMGQGMFVSALAPSGHDHGQPLSPHGSE
ncbi:hypothetical protein D3C78_1713920 [compost metagenome]